MKNKNKNLCTSSWVLHMSSWLEVSIHTEWCVHNSKQNAKQNGKMENICSLCLQFSTSPLTPAHRSYLNGQSGKTHCKSNTRTYCDASTCFTVSPPEENKIFSLICMTYALLLWPMVVRQKYLFFRNDLKRSSNSRTVSFTISSQSKGVGGCFPAQLRN